MLFIRRLSKQMMNLTKQGQQRLQGKVHSAAVCLFPSLQHHLLLTNLTQVKSYETKNDRKKKIKRLGKRQRGSNIRTWNAHDTECNLINLQHHNLTYFREHVESASALTQSSQEFMTARQPPELHTDGHLDRGQREILLLFSRLQLDQYLVKLPRKICNI